LAVATAVDIADHDRQALAGVLIGYDRRGWHGQHRRHEVDRWNNGSRRQQWLWRRSQQRWNHNNWRNERDRRNECDRWNEGKWWNNWRGRRNQQRWKQNGWGNDRDRGNECDRWNERERRNERDWYRVRAGLDALLRSVPQSLGWPLRAVPGIGRCERDRWDPEQRRHWLRWKWQREGSPPTPEHVCVLPLAARSWTVLR